jgi:hypothetical protein
MDRLKSLSVEHAPSLDADIFEGVAAALRANERVVADMLSKTWTNLQRRRAAEPYH